ncbi:hypothetical protein [Streptomyces sp. NBC_01763]|uniref:hypothetical protein n=1 Tax=Streptomyces sp. NBC_01763 TaxID=2975934 RepID=UPI002DD998F6|nr:hypothetical protein [Streptomyces sp. NBC_01763]WSC35650.1 hypothetical protein OHA08_09135 [Streptomyces sp. NBC_01763]
MNSNHQVAGSVPVQAEDPRATAGRVLAMVAAHFTTKDPSDALEPHSLLVCVSAEAHKLADRPMFIGTAQMSRAALAEAPEAPEGITRGEFALLLLKAATACGFDWRSDDSEQTRALQAGGHA